MQIRRFALVIALLGLLPFTNAAVRYVNVNSTNPVSPYLTWATAANVIQDAVDVALHGDEILVTNGVFQTGGRAVHSPAGMDFDGNPRIVGGTVDIGAYEFQSPQSSLSYAWLQQFEFPMDGSVDFADSDGDGANNSQEWRAKTDPTNSASTLRLLSPIISTNGILIRWQSVSGRNYFLERNTDLLPSTSFTLLASNIVGQAGTTVFTDTNVVGTGPFFYRVRIHGNFEDP